MVAKRKIGILAGSWNREREVSLNSAKNVEAALHRLGYETCLIDVSENLHELIDRLNTEKVALVFNALHGAIGEDGTVQGILDYLKIPYTHSNLAASAISMNKQFCKHILENYEINLVQGELVPVANFRTYMPSFEGPYVLKPNASGSAVGVHLEKELLQFSKAQIETYAALFESHPEIYGDAILVEKYIPGLELSVGVFDNRALTVTNIISHTQFYDYEAKYAIGGSSHEIPAAIPQAMFESAMKQAELAHEAIGANFCSRIDFRYDPEEGKVYFLEINTQPGLTQTSLFPEQCQKAKGLSFEAMVEALIQHPIRGSLP